MLRKKIENLRGHLLKENPERCKELVTQFRIEVRELIRASFLDTQVKSLLAVIPEELQQKIYANDPVDEELEKFILRS